MATSGGKALANRTRIGLRDIKAMQPGTKLWDSDVPGLHARRQQSDAVYYVVHYKAPDGKARWHGIGRHGAPWTPDLARAEARRVLEQVAQGKDPAARKMTVGELADAYMADAKAGKLITRRGGTKKASTVAIDAGRVAAHVKPLLGSRDMESITRQDVQRFLHAVADGKTAQRTPSGKKRGVVHVTGGQGTASRTLGLLSAMFAYAVDKGLLEANPCAGVRKFQDRKRERRLTPDEYRALGTALAAGVAQAPRKGPPKKGEQAGGVQPGAVAAVRFLALTGWRSGEALHLCWTDVNLPGRTAILADSKTGRSIRALSRAACAVLEAQPRVKGVDLVFPPSRGDGTMTGFRKSWLRVAALAELPDDISPHTLRHSFASEGGDLGKSEATIGALLGHKQHSITGRYVHLADALLLGAADDVADRVQGLLGEAPAQPGNVVPFRGAA